MSVLVKGMEMPSDCIGCEFVGFDRYADTYYCHKTDINLGESEEYRRPEWCPLVEVKKPHGRIIDYDKLLDGLNNLQNGKMCGELARECTILEAEGEEE